MSWLYTDRWDALVNSQKMSPVQHTALESLEYRMSQISESVCVLYKQYLKKIEDISEDRIDEVSSKIKEDGPKYFDRIKDASTETALKEFDSLNKNIEEISGKITDPVKRAEMAAQEMGTYVVSSYKKALEVYGQALAHTKENAHNAPNGEALVQAVLTMGACGGLKIKMEAQEVVDALSSIAEKRMDLYLKAAECDFGKRQTTNAELLCRISDLDALVQEVAIKAIDMTSGKEDNKLDYAKTYFSKEDSASVVDSELKTAMDTLDKASALIDRVPRNERTEEQKTFANDCQLVKKELTAYAKLFNKIADIAQDTAFEDMSMHKISSIVRKCVKINAANEYHDFENTLKNIGEVFGETAETKALADKFEPLIRNFRNDWEKATGSLNAWKDVNLLKSIVSEEISSILKKDGVLTINAIDEQLTHHLDRIEFTSKGEADQNTRVIVLGALKATLTAYLEADQQKESLKKHKYEKALGE